MLHVLRIVKEEHVIKVYSLNRLGNTLTNNVSLKGPVKYFCYGSANSNVLIATNPRTNFIAQLSSGILSGQAFSLIAGHKVQFSTTTYLHTSKVTALNVPFPNKNQDDTHKLSLGLLSP